MNTPQTLPVERISLIKRATKSVNGLHTFTVFLDNQTVGELKLTLPELDRWNAAMQPRDARALEVEWKEHYEFKISHLEGVVRGREAAIKQLEKTLAKVGEERNWANDALSDARKLVANLESLVVETADGIGKWLSAALEDPKVCADMKHDIEAWFSSLATARQYINEMKG